MIRLLKDRIFLKRAVSTIIAVPIIVALVWFGNPWFAIFAAVWGVGAGWEFFNIVKNSSNARPLYVIGLAGIVLFILSPFVDNIPYMDGVKPVYLLLAALVIIPLVSLLARNNKENAFAAWAWTVSGVLYIGLLLSFYVALRDLDNGRVWVFVAILGTFASDISAYLVGRFFGRHKLAPFVSPNKTWEGAVAGVVGTVILTVIIGGLFYLGDLNLLEIILLGVLISVIGQLGDLVKSLFKRNMTVKDSGNVLPGHGGFLDRMDSIAFAGVLVYFFAVVVGSAA